MIVEMLYGKKYNQVPSKIIDDESMVLAMPCMDGSLHELIKYLNNKEIVEKIILQLSKNLLVLLEKGLYYTDVKPSNILWKHVGNDYVKFFLGDFGSIFEKDNEDASSTYPNPRYMERNDPEFQKPEETTIVWGLCILWVILLRSANVEQLCFLTLKYGLDEITDGNDPRKKELYRDRKRRNIVKYRRSLKNFQKSITNIPILNDMSIGTISTLRDVINRLK